MGDAGNQNVAFLDFLHGEDRICVAKKQIIAACGLLESIPDLFAATEYAVKSPVPKHIFLAFVDAIQKNMLPLVTPEVAPFYRLLSEEFRFAALAKKCDRYARSDPPLNCSIESVNQQLTALDSIIGDVMETRLPSIEASVSDSRIPWGFFPPDGPGIFAFLAGTRGRNVIDDGVVHFTSAGTCFTPAENLVQFNTPDVFRMQRDGSDFFFQFDFQQFRVWISHYSIRWPPDSSRPTRGTNWTIEAFLDGGAPKQIDARTVRSWEPNSVETFACQTMCKARYFRLSSDSHEIAFSGIELYGSLFNPRGLKLPAVGQTTTAREIPWNREFPLDGIISWLTRCASRNVHDAGVVRVSESGLKDNGGFASKSAAEPFTERVFCSTDAPNQWICYDFGDRRVVPTHYAIVSGESDSPRSWILEGSPGGDGWVELDVRTPKDAVRDPHSMGIFHVESPAPCQCVRLRQIDANHSASDILCVAVFELFGCLSERLASGTV
jgi:hypothetical protein